MCSLFCILLLKAQESSADTSISEKIEKIGILFQDGTPSEASILQGMQNETVAEVFSVLFSEFSDY